jgi:hypothetical protein
VDHSTYYQSYKRCRGIAGSILVLSSYIGPHWEDTTTQSPSNLRHVFSAFHAIHEDIQDLILYAFPIVDNKADTLTQSPMLKAHDASQFVAAQPKEIEGLVQLEVFDVKPMSAKPTNARLLSSIWSYRRKISPIGKIPKYKACICIDGSQQEYGRDYWEVYAPVVNWPTIRLMLLLSSILNLKQQQVDYTPAFPQAPLEDPVYMRMPQGWTVDESGNLAQHPDPTFHDRSHFIQLRRNLYGCKQAARNWFKYLTQGLLKEGFCQSAVDPCHFLQDNCILIVYTDDCNIIAKEDKSIDTLIHNLSTSYQLKDQGSV